MGLFSLIFSTRLVDSQTRASISSNLAARQNFSLQSLNPAFSPCRSWHHEQETHLRQRTGPAGPPGMAVQEKREQRLPGHEVEEVLVRAEEDVVLLVQQPAGGSITR